MRTALLFLPLLLAHNPFDMGRIKVLEYITPPPAAEVSFERGDFDWAAPSMTAEALGALEQYKQTGNARYCSPTWKLTPLHAAVLLRDGKLVGKLLAHGADPNARFLVQQGGFLIHQVGADGNIIKRPLVQEGDTPLLLMLRLGVPTHRKNFNALRDIATQLVKAGADVNARDQFGHGVLRHCASHVFLSEENSEDWEDVALHLMELGATIPEKDADDMADHIADKNWSRVQAKIGALSS